MLKIIKSIIIFSLKVLFAAYLCVLIEELIDKILLWIHDKRKGISSIERENTRMEEYYKKTGVHCPICDKWFPVSFDACPLCNKQLSMIQSINKRLELANE